MGLGFVLGVSLVFFTLDGASVMPGIFRIASPVTNTSATLKAFLSFNICEVIHPCSFPWRYKPRFIKLSI